MSTTNMGGSMLGARAALAAMLGVIFNGQRDIYDAAGYAKTLTYMDYYGVYRRQDIARRIVSAAPTETWRLDPTILDGNDEADAADDTPFAEAVQELAAVGQSGQFLIDQPGLFQVLHRLDRVAGIGRYGVLFLGINDGQPPDQPLARGACKGASDLLYTTVYGEGDARIEQYDDDPASPRYGLPLYYTLSTRINAGQAQKRVHWTRCIHVAENVDDDDVFGTPRLESVWNRLVDLLKIMAGSGEAAWKLLDVGQILSTVEGKRLPSDPEQIAALENQVDEFVNGLRRWLLADGIQANAVNGQVTDPTGLVTINVALISAATGIPQRILLGSERGELASIQDESNWTKVIETRQRTQVAPYIIRPTVSRLIYAGVLPAPMSGNFVVQWPNLQESDREREATVAEKVANILSVLGWEVEPDVFLETYLPELPADAVSVPPSPEPPPLGGQIDPQNPAQLEDGADPNDGASLDSLSSDGEPVANTGGANVWAQYP